MNEISIPRETRRWNSWAAARAAEAAGHPPVFLRFQPGGTYPSGWIVEHLRQRTDPSMIHNNGRKLFTGPRGSKARQEAQDWAGSRYGVAEWVKVPGLGGDYFPSEAVPAIRAAHKAAQG